jgi:hypothetical protein
VRLHRLFFLAISALFVATLAHASTLPFNFEVDLNDCPAPSSTNCTNPNGSGGWLSDGTPDSFTDAVNTVNPSENDDFSEGTFICSTDDDSECEDPEIQLKPGGDAPFPGPFSADANGGGVFDFTTGTTSPFSSVAFFTTLNDNVTYECASPLYNFCGFQAIDNDTVLEVVFDSPAATSAVPEPSEYLFFLVAGAAIAVLHRLRSRRKSA